MRAKRNRTSYLEPNDWTTTSYFVRGEGLLVDRLPRWCAWLLLHTSTTPGGCTQRAVTQRPTVLETGVQQDSVACRMSHALPRSDCHPPSRLYIQAISMITQYLSKHFGRRKQRVRGGIAGTASRLDSEHASRLADSNDGAVTS